MVVLVSCNNENKTYYQNGQIHSLTLAKKNDKDSVFTYATHYIAIAEKYIDTDFNGGLKTDANGVKLQFNNTPMQRVIPGMSWEIEKVKNGVKAQRILRDATSPTGDGGVNDPKANSERNQG